MPPCNLLVHTAVLLVMLRGGEGGACCLSGCTDRQSTSTWSRPARDDVFFDRGPMLSLETHRPALYLPGAGLRVVMFA
jgi:hypothetical protein